MMSGGRTNVSLPDEAPHLVRPPRHQQRCWRCAAVARAWPRRGEQEGGVGETGRSGEDARGKGRTGKRE
jgi:hypothetical protein